MENRLKDKYVSEVIPALQQKFNYKNVMQIPKVEKIVINMGLGDCKDNPKGLEAAVGGKHGVVMAGQDDLNRRLGSGGDLQGVSVGFLAHRTVVGDGGRALGRDALDHSGQAASLGLQHIQHGVQPGGVAAAGVDVRPVDGASDDGLASRGDVVEDGLVGGQNPHRPDPRRTDRKGEGRDWLDRA